MRLIISIAREFGLYIIEDAAQAFGARLDDHPAGSFGDIGSFSMNPMKTFSSYGEAGGIVFDNLELRDTLSSIRYQGVIEKEDYHQPSINGRIDTIQAAMMICSY